MSPQFLDNLDGRLYDALQQYRPPVLTPELGHNLAFHWFVHQHGQPSTRSQAKALKKTLLRDVATSLDRLATDDDRLLEGVRYWPDITRDRLDGPLITCRPGEILLWTHKDRREQLAPDQLPHLLHSRVFKKLAARIHHRWFDQSSKLVHAYWTSSGSARHKLFHVTGCCDEDEPLINLRRFRLDQAHVYISLRRHYGDPIADTWQPTIVQHKGVEQWRVGNQVCCVGRLDVYGHKNNILTGWHALPGAPLHERLFDLISSIADSGDGRFNYDYAQIW